MNMIEIDNHFVLRLASFILQTLLLKKSVNSRKLNKMFAQAKQFNTQFLLTQKESVSSRNDKLTVLLIEILSVIPPVPNLTLFPPWPVCILFEINILASFVVFPVFFALRFAIFDLASVCFAFKDSFSRASNGFLLANIFALASNPLGPVETVRFLDMLPTFTPPLESLDLPRKFPVLIPPIGTLDIPTTLPPLRFLG